jgi:hypothetical protein
VNVVHNVSFILGVKVIEELLNAHQPQQHTHPDNTSRQYVVVPSEPHSLFQQFSSSNVGEQNLIADNNQLNQLTQAIQKAINGNTQTGDSVQNQTQLQEAIRSLLSDRVSMQHQTDNLITRNRSLSSSMEASINGNESSNSALSSSVTSPLQGHMQHNTIMLNKIKDEPQHVPTMRTNTSSSSIEHVNLEQNELLKKEKKRERNRQVNRFN